MDEYRNFIFYRTYSRWIEELGRRETWEETVKRYMDYMISRLGNKLSADEYSDIHNSILRQEVMPSMRLLWSAGKTVDKTNAAAYNCSFTTPTKIKNFGEIVYLLMCGCGVGYSVEEQFVSQLPVVQPQTGKKRETFEVPDSREGWADALVEGMRAWYAGEDVVFDYSKLRPLGAPLKTMGGRSSGPGPLKSLLEHTRRVILSRQGMQLRPIDVHDIITKIGEVVVAGGTRRSAQISLSDLGDDEMRHAKVGAFWEHAPHRALANNSAVYTEKPDIKTFMREWIALMESGTGERGIFVRNGMMPDRRWELLGKDRASILGTNPCGEILLQPKQFCNLSEVVVRPEDTKKTLLNKARVAAIIGTYQASLTDFSYLSHEWKKTTEEEALLGVSLTGQYDNAIAREPSVLRAVRDEVVETNKHYAKKFGINQASSATAVKPSGTVSQLVDASSGIHPRFAKYYVRRVRISSSDPVFHLLKDLGIPHFPEIGQTPEDAHTWVLEFPRKSPDDAVVVGDVNAIDQLEYWKVVKENFTEHNPSCTIYVGDDEWLEVGAWVYRNWHIVGGLSFLPRDNHVYQLAPYEKIDKKEYERRMKTFPKIDFSRLTDYERNDNTEGAKSYACVAGVCEI